MQEMRPSSPFLVLECRKYGHLLFLLCWICRKCSRLLFFALDMQEIWPSSLYCATVDMQEMRPSPLFIVLDMQEMQLSSLFIVLDMQEMWPSSSLLCWICREMQEIHMYTRCTLIPEVKLWRPRGMCSLLVSPAYPFHFQLHGKAVFFWQNIQFVLC